ncbi:twin-arginine translocase TatA/TatE family subunit [Paenibacillus thalictri]|uniref:Sec-independent protein translocase protein TatA n=1 Tax=Paenibacillus thalictri TaxID=2527873 RepID=A0A4Q9DG14_9BACL|nr:twin-arginine translocase TatA/TatE family subunit [Paenibacillus thalictri]
MFGNLGVGELLLIALLALVLFGPSKLPELGRMLGRTIREFKNTANELMSTEPVQPKDAPQPQTQAQPPSQPQMSAERQSGESKPIPSDNRRLPD